ncbi:hypothetical protein [Kitasatospora sp. NPDC056800]|uniref:hypothetical protein n=1 Tax=Kitasatospora sp. NPDC056800 TaxID=3345948 RepID=UPI0036CB9246
MDGGDYLAAAARSRIHIWNLATTELHHTIPTPNPTTIAAVPMPDGRAVLASGDGSSVRLWDPVGGGLLQIVITSVPVRALAAQPEGKRPTVFIAGLNSEGQYAYYGRVGGCLITGNEDGAKHCAMNVLYSLQHLGYTIPPQADAGWVGEAGPGPSYLSPGSGGPENDFTNRNTTFMTWNQLHLARMLKDAGGIPAHGNQRSEWDAGCRFDFENPEHR